MKFVEDSAGWGLVGDIGATNARFALVHPNGSIGFARAILSQDHSTVGEAIATFLRAVPDVRLSRSVLAVATSPQGDYVSFTNHHWTFSIEELRQKLGLRRLRVVNDFHANALAIPHLGPDELVKIGAGQPVSEAPIAIIGPGTGLGVSALVPTGKRPIVVPGEGGHVTMPAADEREAEVLEIVRRRFGHASAERILSGPGLVNLYRALCELADAPAADLTGEQICHPETLPDEHLARAALEMFCAMLGSVAGNLALTFGARGGVYIFGGIVKNLGSIFERSAFRDRFEAKGRFRNYLAQVPSYVVVRPFAALLGASRLLHEA